MSGHHRHHHWNCFSFFFLVVSRKMWFFVLCFNENLKKKWFFSVNAWKKEGWRWKSRQFRFIFLNVCKLQFSYNNLVYIKGDSLLNILQSKLFLSCWPNILGARLRASFECIQLCFVIMLCYIYIFFFFALLFVLLTDILFGVHTNRSSTVSSFQEMITALHSWMFVCFHSRFAMLCCVCLCFHISHVSNWAGKRNKKKKERSLFVKARLFRDEMPFNENLYS